MYQCNAMADAAAWAAVGCVVSGTVTGTKRSDLGDGTFPPSLSQAPPTDPLTQPTQLPSFPGAGMGILLNHVPGRRP